MSEPSFSNSKQTTIETEIESVGSGPGHGHQGQKAKITAATKEESSFTDKEAFRIPNGPEPSTEQSSMHIKITDSVNSQDTKEQNFSAAGTEARPQNSFGGFARGTAPMTIQAPLSSLNHVLSQLPIKVVKRKVVLETVTKTVTEKKENVKAVTDQTTGIEHKDSHLESTTKEEVQSKREEETIESYDSAANVRQGTLSNPIIASTNEEKQVGIASSPILGSSLKAVQSPKESVASKSAPDIKGVKEQTCQTPEKIKRAKQPVAIRVHDDTLAEDEEVASRKEEHVHMDLEPKSILKPLSRPAVQLAQEAQPDKKHLGFQDADRAENVPLHLVEPTASTKQDENDDDSEEAALPPPRFKFNRKDSIAVTKLRMMKQAEEFSEEEDEHKKDSESFLASSTAADDMSAERSAIFRPPVVIHIEEPQPASIKDTVQSYTDEVDASTSHTAVKTLPCVELTGTAANGKDSGVTNKAQSKVNHGLAETKTTKGMTTVKSEQSHCENLRVPQLMEHFEKSSNGTASFETKQDETEKTVSDTFHGTSGSTDTSSIHKPKPPRKAQKVDYDEKQLPEKHKGCEGAIVFGSEDDEQKTGKSGASIEQSRPMDLLHIAVDASQIQGQATVTDEKVITQPCVSRTVKEVKNVENSVVTSETEEVFYYPKEKVTKKHISETKVLTETRSYTEIVIEPNYSGSSVMPAIPEENEQLPVVADTSRQILNDRSSCKEGSVSTEANETEAFRAVALISNALSREVPENDEERIALQSQHALDDKCSTAAKKADSFQTLTDFAPYEPEQPLSIQSIHGTTKPLDRVGDQTMVELPSSDFDTCKGIIDRTQDELPPLHSVSGSRTNDDALSGPTELLSTVMDDMGISGLVTTRDIDSYTRRRPDVQFIATCPQPIGATTMSSSESTNDCYRVIYICPGKRSRKPKQKTNRSNI
ncbi:hypothetical protein HPB50_027925 [Hyalomma asiaticum]|nr:hypothetical protein HPB50_027925 [Hyalomma asiaticum]